MNLLSQRGEDSTSRLEKVSRLGEEMEAALTGAKAAPASRRAAELRSWSVRITLEIHRLEVLGVNRVSTSFLRMALRIVRSVRQIRNELCG